MVSMKKTLFVIGSGGREHALGWKLAQSSDVDKIYFAPGNAGTSLVGENVAIGSEDISKLVDFAKEKHITLTIVGPEIPLSAGIVDKFSQKGLSIFGPTHNAAMLETSKAWAGEFMKRHNIPYPRSYTFTDIGLARDFINSRESSQLVIKASGLAAGKGVVLPTTRDEALKWITKIMEEKVFGTAGEEVVVQERLIGKEVSVIAVTDGTTIFPFIPAQDHKRVFDNDQGPNTGGMGAYAPVPFVNEILLAQIHKEILQPTIDGMRKEGNLFKGVLYAGLMITSSGPKVLEFNVRFGDPETQPLMMLLDSDLLTICEACVLGTLHKGLVRFKKGAAVSVVLTANGYPGSFVKGEVIHGLEKVTDPTVQVFHAGTTQNNRRVVTSGGRVLAITSYAESFDQALKKAYKNIGKNGVNFSKMHYRKDIGFKTI